MILSYVRKLNVIRFSLKILRTVFIYIFETILFHFVSSFIFLSNRYSFRKVLETWFKGLYNDSKKISAVAPTLYARRMLSFLGKYTQQEIFNFENRHNVNIRNAKINNFLLFLFFKEIFDHQSQHVYVFFLILFLAVRTGVSTFTVYSALLSPSYYLNAVHHLPHCFLSKISCKYFV